MVTKAERGLFVNTSTKREDKSPYSFRTSQPFMVTHNFLLDSSIPGLVLFFAHSHKLCKNPSVLGGTNLKELLV